MFLLTLRAIYIRPGHSTSSQTPALDAGQTPPNLDNPARSWTVGHSTEKPCFKGRTREECTYKCIIEKYYQDTGWHSGYYLTNSSMDKNLILEFDNYTLEYEKHCEESCSKFTDCYKEYFQISPNYMKDYVSYYKMVFT